MAGVASEASAWDKAIPDTIVGDIRIRSNKVSTVWFEMVNRGLLRANLYLDDAIEAEADELFLTNGQATGAEVFDKFLAAFPEYTDTQDAKTGVIWFHPKRVKYEGLLPEKVRLNRPIHQVAASKIVLPLCGSISVIPTEFANKGGDANSYYVDLPIGDYSARDLLNLCCLANPSKGFILEHRSGREFITPVSFYYRNPLAPPRPGALSFWKIEIGMAKSTNGIPDASELSAALSSSNPRKRWAARAFLEATPMNYEWTDLVQSADSAEAKVWVGIGIKAAFLRGVDAPRFFAANLGPAFESNIEQIKDPSLALVISLELAKEKQEQNRLDKIVRGHEFSVEEVNNIKPDIYRLFNESKLVRVKLKSLKLGTPQFSVEALGELEQQVRIEDKVGPFYTTPPENLFEVLPGNAN